jgi:hypothetical protein
MYQLSKVGEWVRIYWYYTFYLLLRQTLMKFDLGHLTFFSLSPFSLCRIYPWGRSFQTKLLKRYFLVFLLSVEALMKFDLGRFNLVLLGPPLHPPPLPFPVDHSIFLTFLLAFLLSVCSLPSSGGCSVAQ